VPTLRAVRKPDRPLGTAYLGDENSFNHPQPWLFPTEQVDTARILHRRRRHWNPFFHEGSDHGSDPFGRNFRGGPILKRVRSENRFKTSSKYFSASFSSRSNVALELGDSRLERSGQDLHSDIAIP
jgi:hypothetical protein